MIKRWTAARRYRRAIRQEERRFRKAVGKLVKAVLPILGRLNDG